MLLVLVLLVGTLPMAQTAQSPAYYSDVRVSAWYYNDVMRICQYGYMNGMSSNTFAPESALTRAMTVTILGRMWEIDLDQYTGETVFADVSSDSWYGPYVCWAVENGITTGMSADAFAPEDPVTREQMATFISRFCQQMGWILTETADPAAEFQDISQVSEYAVESLELMRVTGIILGDPSGCFNPKNPIIRAEVAAMLSRLIDAAGEQDEELDAVQSTKYIIHAGGSLDGYTLTNSKEALENAYTSGNRLIEIDFGFTSDGYPVCIHDWNYRLYPGFVEDEYPTLEEYLQCKVYDEFTPMWLGTIADYLTIYPDLYIITDTKEQNVLLAQIIARDYPDLMNQFIIQVYSQEEYFAVLELGFEKIIFTLYALSWSEKTDCAYLVEFAENNPLFAYTFPAELCDIDGYVENMLQSGVPLFIHTVNDLQQQEAYFEIGISGIYTDNTMHE